MNWLYYYVAFAVFFGVLLTEDYIRTVREQLKGATKKQRLGAITIAFAFNTLLAPIALVEAIIRKTKERLKAEREKEHKK